MAAFEDYLYPLLKGYMSAPRWLMRMAGGVYSTLPKSLRFGGAYDRFSKDAATTGPDALSELSVTKLQATLTWALSSVPAYHSFYPLLKRDQTAHELLSQLPIVTKSDIKSKSSDYLSSAIDEKYRMRMFTGGSTAQPMQFYLQRGVTRSKEYAFVHAFFRLGGIDPNQKVVLAMRGRSVPGASRPGNPLWMYEPIKRHLILSSDHLEEPYMPAYVKALRQWKPVAIEAFPSALYPLARWLGTNPAPDITERIKVIFLTSENVYPYQDQLFREVFPACKVLKHYGHSERVVMATTLPGDDRYFFWPQYGWLELLRPDGQPVTKPGELGEIVGTSFDNQVMPFVRYRTGDFATLGDEQHSPRPGYPVCRTIEGRLQEFVVCKDHRLISITTLGAAHFNDLASVEAIQYEQFEPGILHLKVASKTRLDGETKARIAQAVSDKTQNSCQTEIHEVESIERTPRNKHRMMIQHLDIRRYLGASAIEGAN